MNGLDDLGRCKVTWVEKGDNVFFRCTRQLDTFNYPAHLDRCFLSRCPTRCPRVEPSDLEEHIDEEQYVPRLQEEPRQLCHRCGEVYRNLSRPKYCSNRCNIRASRSAYKKRKRLEKKRIKASMRVCVNCGVEFVPTGGRATFRKHCSDGCRLRFARRSWDIRKREERKKAKRDEQANIGGSRL